MFYMPKYHNLPDGRQVFLRFPDPVMHAEPLIAFHKQVCGETPFLSDTPEEVTATAEEAAAALQAINADPCRLVILAEIAGEIAGAGELSIIDQDRERHRAHLSLALQEKYWGLGLGTLLMEALIGVGNQKGLDYLELLVIEDNARALLLYEKLGFERVCFLPDAFRRPDGSCHGEITMRKTL